MSLFKGEALPTVIEVGNAARIEVSKAAPLAQISPPVLAVSSLVPAVGRLSKLTVLVPSVTEPGVLIPVCNAKTLIA